MKPKHTFFQKYLFVWVQEYLNTKRARQLSAHRGFTLIELLVAALLTSVVILISWSGLINVLNMSQVAEAKTARQTELNRALDFMTNEIRMARSINQSATATANGTTVSVVDVVTSSGLNLASLGNYGTIGLYLERPTSPNIPTSCPAGGPNAGITPPSPADYDRVVYDIRPSPNGWLAPQILMRYGRVPNQDGTVNPCGSPIASDPMMDALATTQSQPSCSGILSGDGGFYSCVNGKQVDLYLQSNIQNMQSKSVSSSVSSRVMTQPPASSASTLNLTVTPRNNKFKELDFSWRWANDESATHYVLTRTWKGALYTIYSGSSTTLSKYKTKFAKSGDTMCFTVTAQNPPATTIDSNQVCLSK
jgi:prepilin-type N-terminal cleavage/methylation domain-containing protein